jgi:misacylated tRNA(Ala) deacylase
MTRALFLDDAYLRDATTRVLKVTEEGHLVPEASLFYPTGGGQPGDGGVLRWEGGETAIATTVKGPGPQIALVPAPGAPLPPPGAEVRMVLDWERRWSHMRVHTALHLLSVVMPFGVTGGAISVGKGRLDFDMAEPPDDKAAIADRLNAIIESDAPVSARWISEAELDSRPELVKTMKVKPPRGAGQVRLVQIGADEALVDLQPCGGTHVRSLAEIGSICLGKTEKKGRMNRRVYLHLAG